MLSRLAKARTVKKVQNRMGANGRRMGCRDAGVNPLVEEQVKGGPRSKNQAARLLILPRRA